MDGFGAVTANAPVPVLDVSCHSLFGAGPGPWTGCDIYAICAVISLIIGVETGAEGGGKPSNDENDGSAQECTTDSGLQDLLACLRRPQHAGAHALADRLTLAPPAPAD